MYQIIFSLFSNYRSSCRNTLPHLFLYPILVFSSPIFLVKFPYFFLSRHHIPHEIFRTVFFQLVFFPEPMRDLRASEFCLCQACVAYHNLLLITVFSKFKVFLFFFNRVEISLFILILYSLPKVTIIYLYKIICRIFLWNSNKRQRQNFHFF